MRFLRLLGKSAYFDDISGTTYSAVAVFRNGIAEIIQNDHGNRITPSCVGFTQTERIVGEGAIYQAADNPENTIYGRFFLRLKLISAIFFFFQESNVYWVAKSMMKQYKTISVRGPLK